MLAQKYRPQKFSDVVGQEEAVSVLRMIAMRPDTSPRCIILHGPYGTGKTTLTRIFGKALNCLQKKGDPCGQCEICREDSEFNPLYQENDSNQVGNVAFIREYQDTLRQTSPADGRYRVVVFDEIQGASTQSMDAMLKILEEAPERTFFVFATTDVERILDTIRSRSVELALHTLHVEEIANRLKDLTTSENMQVPEDVLRQIAIQSSGHMRDAVMKLDVYLLCDDKSKFASIISSCEDTVLEFLMAARRKDKAAAEACVMAFMRRPLAHLFRDWEVVVLNLLKGFSGSPLEKYQPVISAFGADVFRLLRAMASDWGSRCFRDDVLFQAFVWYLFYELGKDAPAAGAAPAAAKFSKA